MSFERLLVPGLVLGLAGVSYWLVSSNVFLFGAFALAALLSFRAGSLSRLVAITWLYIFLVSATSMLFSIFFSNFKPIYLNNFFLIASFLLTVFLSDKYWKFKVSWQNDLFALAISGLTVLSLASSKMFRPGGAIAILFSNEDNAAWVASSFAARGEAEGNSGIFGPLIDFSLYVYRELSLLVFPSLGEADHIALSVVLSGIALLASIPFLVNALLSWLGTINSGFNYSPQVLSIGLVLASANFIFYGHLTAAIALVFLTLMTVTLLAIKDGFDLLPMASAIFFASVLVVSETWFPIAPIAIFMALVLLLRDNRSPFKLPRKELAVFIWGVFISLLIGWQVLYQRFLKLSPTAEGNEGSAFDGASLLLTIEGGVAPIGSYSFLVVGILTMTVFAVLVSIGFRVGNVLTPVIVAFVFAFAVKSVNILLSGGTVNYASRKIDNFIVLFSVIFLTWLFKYALEKSEAKHLPSWGPFVISVIVLSQIPSTDAMISRNGFYGLNDPNNQRISQAISSGSKSGTALVCVTSNDTPYPNDERFLAYKCSRFASAFTNTDSNTVNDWRLAMLGGKDESIYKEISESLPIDTNVILVEDSNAGLQEVKDSKFGVLLNPNWPVLNSK